MKIILKKYNKKEKDLNKILENETITRIIKAKRMKWYGHVQRRGNEAIIKKIMKWNPLNTGQRGRPKLRWEDQVINDIKKMGITRAKEKMQDRKEWQKITEKAKKHINL
ncbi:hypothetical protein RN001_004340 [Aquatica leii]|uniref:Endonuclease-reverse transcriptase n=1 Tax=Aquatica leii TaxID=1421715 RepID=A0AAN7PEB7_9COLE|nr:hypothetical protein RN001_004340 [Aquatica leii]